MSNISCTCYHGLRSARPSSSGPMERATNTMSRVTMTSNAMVPLSPPIWWVHHAARFRLQRVQCRVDDPCAVCPSIRYNAGRSKK
jgi:hypothetical protein